MSNTESSKINKLNVYAYASTSLEGSDVGTVEHYTHIDGYAKVHKLLANEIEEGSICKPGDIVFLDENGALLATIVFP